MKRFLLKFLSICLCVSVICFCFSCTGEQKESESFKPESEESTVGERYTLNVKYHALSDSVSQMIFDTEIGFSAYKETRENYVFKGLEYDGFFYEYDRSTNTYGALGDEIQFQSAKVIDVTAVWECNYPSEILFNFSPSAEYTLDGEQGRWVVQGIKDGETSPSTMILKDLIVCFEDKEGEGYFDVNTNIFDFFINQYTNITTKNGESVEFTGDVDMFVRVNGVTIDDYLGIAIENETLTFAEILSYTQDINGNLESVTEIKICFYYEVV